VYRSYTCRHEGSRGLFATAELLVLPGVRSNKPILLQIGRSGPLSKGNFVDQRVKGQCYKRSNFEVRFGGLAEASFSTPMGGAGFLVMYIHIHAYWLASVQALSMPRGYDACLRALRLAISSSCFYYGRPLSVSGHPCYILPMFFF